MGPCDVMCQNPWNAVICLGHTKGCVTMWSPNMAKPLAKMICHRGPVKGIAVDNAGYYLATSGLDNTVKIWDVRTFKPIASYATHSAATSLAISQRGLLAVAGGPHVQVWRREVMTKGVASPYVAHLLPGAAVREVRFCPYEDFLGVGHSGGFTSMVVPGAGEPNYDALEANPFESKKQRRETEVARLLEKIPATMISLNPGSVGGIASLEERRAQETQDEANARPADTEDGEINPYDEEFEGMGIDAEQNEKRKARKEALRAKHKREGRHRKSKIIIIQEKEGDAQSKKRKDGKKVVDHVSDALDLFSKKVKI